MDKKNKLKDNKLEEKSSKLKEIKKKIEDVPISAKKSYLQEKIDEQKEMLESKKIEILKRKEEKFDKTIIYCKEHIENDGIHLNFAEKKDILSHQDNYHAEEKQVDSIISAVNSNIEHSNNDTIHFDNEEQKDDVLELLKDNGRVTVVSGGGGKGATGDTGAEGADGANGTDGLYGGDSTVYFWAPGDTSPGNMAPDDTNFDDITQIHLNYDNANLDSVVGWLQSFNTAGNDDRLRLRLFKEHNDTVWAVYDVTSITSNPGNETFEVTHVASSTTNPSDDDRVVASFVEQGGPGSSGATGTFTTVDGKTVTVTGGYITNIV